MKKNVQYTEICIRLYAHIKIKFNEFAVLSAILNRYFSILTDKNGISPIHLVLNFIWPTVFSVVCKNSHFNWRARTTSIWWFYTPSFSGTLISVNHFMLKILQISEYSIAHKQIRTKMWKRGENAMKKMNFVSNLINHQFDWNEEEIDTYIGITF